MVTHSPVPDIPGIKADWPLAQEMRREVANMLGRGHNISFPGAQPVSFASRHLEELKQTDYYLCEKSDGIRCLMYFTRDGDREVHYLIDRKNDYYWVQNLHFPMPEDETFRSFHTDTLIDGELVLDDIGDGKRLLRYLVFDCLFLDGKNLMKRTLDKRLGYFREYVFKPYKLLCTRFPEEVPYFPFEVEFKKMELSYGIQLMFGEILPKLPHGNDGLIFTCRTTPYKFGTDEHIIKWKPVSENSIDFRLKLEFPPLEPDSDDPDSDADEPAVDYDAIPRFDLSVFMGDNRYEKYAEMYVPPEQWEELKGLGMPLDWLIVECAMDEQKRWRYMRFRKDKEHGNHISTVESVMESVRDAVSKEDLIQAAAGIRTAWKARAAGVAGVVGVPRPNGNPNLTMNANANANADADAGGNKRKRDENDQDQSEEATKRRAAAEENANTDAPVGDPNNSESDSEEEDD